LGFDLDMHLGQSFPKIDSVATTAPNHVAFYEYEMLNTRIFLQWPSLCRGRCEVTFVARGSILRLFGIEVRTALAAVHPDAACRQDYGVDAQSAASPLRRKRGFLVGSIFSSGIVQKTVRPLDI
jgi:hypothetical protein